MRRTAYGRWIPLELTYEKGPPPAHVGFYILGPLAAPAEWPPAAMVVDDGTLATAGLDEVSATAALLTKPSLVSTASDALLPALMVCVGGVRVSDGTGI